MSAKNESNALIRYRHVNVKLILTVLAVGLCFAAGIYFLHGYQVQRNATTLLDQAERDRKDGNLDDAMRVYRQYLALRPNDAEALATYAGLLDETGVTPRERVQAYLRYQETLRRDPTRKDIRRKSIDIAVELYRFDNALTDIEILRKDNPNDAELTALAARCHEGLSAFGRAAEMYTAALSQKNAVVENYVGLVDLVLNHTADLDLKKADPKQRDSADARQVADALMDFAVEKGSPKQKGLLARARYFKQQEKLNEASKDIRAALALDDKDPDVLLEAIDISLAQAIELERLGKAQDGNKLLQEANSMIERGVSLEPPDLRFYLARSRMALRDGSSEKAVAALRDGIEVAKKRRKASGKIPPKALQIQEQNLTFTLADVLITRAAESEKEVNEADIAEAQALSKQLRDMNIFEALSDFLEARILAARREWYDASVKLQEIRSAFEEQPEILKRVDLALSDCYRRLGNPDKQLDVWRRAAKNASWDEARWNLAASLTLTGRIEEAIEEYRPIANRPQVAIEVAQLLFLQQMNLPASKRDWTACRQLLERIQAATNDWPRVPILLAEIEVQNKQFDKAHAVLAAALTTFPDEPIVWASFAELALRRTDGDAKEHAREAEQILNDATQKLGDKIELRLARLSAASGMVPQRAKEVLADVEKNIDQLSAEDQHRLIMRLAQSYQRLGAREEAGRLWLDLARRFPRDVTAQWYIAELAMQNNDRELAKKTLNTIRELEGAGGPIGNYLEAVAMVRPDDSPEQRKAAEPEARRLLQEVVKNRPSWAAGWRALGMLEEMFGNKSQAIEHFRKAMAYGDRSRDVATRVIQALYLQQRYDEADEELRRLTDDDPTVVAGDLARLAWQVAWERQQFDRALGLAGEVASDSANHRDLIWLSQLRFARGLRGDEVEQPLRDAVKMAPQAAETWYALVAFLARVGRVADAESAIKDAAAKIPAEEVSLFEAHCFELLDSPERAEERYLAAASAEQHNPDDIQALADFYSRRGENEKAEKYLDQLLDPKTEAPEASVVWARRRKAMLVAARGGYQSTHQALALLDLNPQAEQSSASNDLRLKAAILASRNTRRDRLAAIDVYKQISNLTGLNSADNFQLAQLHELTGDWPSAQKLMLDILTAQPESAEFIAYHGGALIRQGELDDARLWVGRLERVEPETFRTAKIVAELDAAASQPEQAANRLTKYFKTSPRKKGLEEIEKLVAEGKLNEAIDRLAQLSKSLPAFRQEGLVEQLKGLSHAGNKEAAVTRLTRFIEVGKKLDEQMLTSETLYAAQLFERIGRPDEAQQFFEAYYRRSPDPMSVMPYCRFLAQRGDIDKSLDICEKSRLASKPDLLAQAGVSILTESNPTTDHIRRVEKWVQAAPSQSGVLAQADLLLMQRRLADAEKIYRFVLSTDPGNVVALNNLAWLLAFEQRSTDEALTFINKAIEVAGHRAELVDTRGNVYLSANRTKEAINDLKDAVADSGAAAMYLHLVKAYLQAGNRVSASETWTQAQRHGLDPMKLHPLDRSVFDQVKPQIAQATSTEVGGETKRQ